MLYGAVVEEVLKKQYHSVEILKNDKNVCIKIYLKCSLCRSGRGLVPVFVNRKEVKQEKAEVSHD